MINVEIYNERGSFCLLGKTLLLFVTEYGIMSQS